MSVSAHGAHREVEADDAEAADPERPAALPQDRGNLLLEMALAYVKPSPLRLFQAGWWAIRGLGHLEVRLIERSRRESPVARADTAHIVIMAAGPIGATPRAAFPRQGSGEISGHLVKSLRLHQWTKNLLVFVPIVLAGQLTDRGSLTDTVIAFFALCVIASSTYLINDMWDITDDRRHWSKRHRPIASGRLPVTMAAATVPVGITVGFALAAMASTAVVLLLAAYLVVTIAYTVGLKRLVLVDGVVLAFLFTLRLALGVVAADVPPSAWLIVFSMFLFASLSYAKRHTEITRVAHRRGQEVNGRGYRTSDAPVVLAMGLATGIGAVVILVLYIVQDAFAQTFYGNTAWLWAFPPLLFLFVTRIWLACLRDELDDDPVAFALSDRACLGLAAAGIVSFMLAWLGTA